MKSKKSKPWRWTKTPRAKSLFQWSRWLHVYLSTALFTLLLFFSVTGITLNHPQWAADTSAPEELSTDIPGSIRNQLLSQSGAALDGLTDHIALTTGLSDPRSIDVDWELGEIEFDYPLPAGYAFVIAELDSGTLLIEHKQGSLLALLNDLHKGRHTGPAWSWLIDISAAVISIFAITGMIILLQHKRYRRAGLSAALAGTLLPWLYYWLYVPAL